MRRALFLAGALAAACAGPGAARSPAVVGAYVPCAPVPDGAAAVVVWSAGWCGACRDGLRALAADRARLNAAGVVVVEVVTDAADCPAARHAAHSPFVPAVPSAGADIPAELPLTVVTTRGRPPTVYRGVPSAATVLGAYSVR